MSMDQPSMAVDIQPDPPFYALTEDDQAALVVVASLIFLVYAIVGISLKLIIRLNITSLKSHDVILLVATGLLLSQTVCIIIACNHGLGHHQDIVEPHDLEAFHKFFYASSILAIAIVASTKISLCLLIHSINNHGRLNLANKVLFGAIVAWGISGITMTAFQCSLPQPWLATASKKCPGREGIFLYNGVMDIFTDVCLCLLPVAMMWKVQTALKRKAMVVALFTTRIIIPIITIPRLIHTHIMVTDYTDTTWNAVHHIIWLQVSLGMSILTACIPSLKGVIDSLLGSTSVAAIQAPYHLSSSGKDGGRLQPTTWPIGSGSNTRPGSHLASGAGDSRIARAGLARVPEWSIGCKVHGYAENVASGRSESVRKLTEDGEFGASSDERRRSSSQEGSMKSAEADLRL
ncbi:uncharacterized protein CCOS01_09831 [Colletotrichum costaricense]|uniref:Rhodopsin domain-containing protein n=1 Tax=Colletotrichum costaricense TaxID=1209916 RepID=A0AAI9YSB6_9PEZI|nr:uncharacterized protein CCOS01_09831 [Colletotrichum costaricense]KAK1522119.1 hypothetical protein CCOS01_09831 [Colletotrichum costaricense]